MLSNIHNVRSLLPSHNSPSRLFFEYYLFMQKRKGWQRSKWRGRTGTVQPAMSAGGDNSRSPPRPTGNSWDRGSGSDTRTSLSGRRRHTSTTRQKSLPASFWSASSSKFLAKVSDQLMEVMRLPFVYKSIWKFLFETERLFEQNAPNVEDGPLRWTRRTPNGGYMWTCSRRRKGLYLGRTIG